MAEISSKISRFFKDKDGRWVIWQRPNLPIIVWAATLVISNITQGTVSTAFSIIATMALGVWAILEVGWGQSQFRRVLGAVILAVVAWQYR